MRNTLIRLVVMQFAVYTILAVLGFAAWTMAFSENLSILEMIVGEYIRGHLARWTAQFPLWGMFTLISAVFSLTAAWLLNKSRRKGGYLGVLSFLIGFVVNILFARNILVHSLIGILIGWTLLAPLSVLWKSLES